MYKRGEKSIYYTFIYPSISNFINYMYHIHCPIYNPDKYLLQNSIYFIYIHIFVFNVNCNNNNRHETSENWLQLQQSFTGPNFQLLAYCQKSKTTYHLQKETCVLVMHRHRKLWAVSADEIVKEAPIFFITKLTRQPLNL